MVQELMETNGGCQLPCWWGIVPGETTWEETKAFLSPFALLIGSPFRDGNYMHYDVYIPVSESERLIDNKVVTFYIKKTGNEIEMIHAGIEYPLVNLMEKFGKPDQIWFRSEGLPAIGPPQYKITLVYTVKDIAVHMEGFGTLLEGDDPKIEICPQQINPIQGFYLWSPGNGEVVNEVMIPRLTRPGPGDQERVILPLEKVTNFNIDDFYSTFSNLDATECIKAPLGIWP